MARTYIYAVLITSYPRHPSRAFDYLSEEKLQPGEWVIVPFGRTQTIGIIMMHRSSAEVETSKLKVVIRKLDYPSAPSHYLPLADWLSSYYAAHTRSVWQTMLPAGLKAKPRKQALVTSSQEASSPELPTLAPEQARIVTHITSLPMNRAVLLQGITGSGKTRIYEELIIENLRAGKSALVLAPEIVLSTHLRQRLEVSLGAHLHVTHSGLTATKRRSVWLEALTNNSPRVYLGARSALFLPIRNLGLIILDEEHDASYKQDQNPRYHAVQVAGRLAQLTGARLILGSATPALTTLELVNRGRIERVALNQRHGGGKLPAIDTIEHKNKDGILSTELKTAISRRLQDSEQILILHNKRGTARRLHCENCGSTVHCTYCDTTLVFHADVGRLKCHVCNREQWPPSKCPSCNHAELRYSGIGTKQLESHLRDLYPQAKIERLDRDSIDRDGLPALLERMHNQEIDILIGTQMIAKGLDFPHVTLVAIIDTDSLIQGSDFGAAERAASLIIQAAGRSGRSTKHGAVLLQTHNPEQQILKPIRAHDWDAFASQELKHRKQFHYPPYSWILRLWVRRSNEKLAETSAEELVELLRTSHHHIEVLGPATPLRHKEGIYHTRQIVVRAKSRQTLVTIATQLPSGWQADLDPLMII